MKKIKIFTLILFIIGNKTNAQQLVYSNINQVPAVTLNQIVGFNLLP